MNKDKMEGQWKDMKGKVKQKWAKLTDDDIQGIEGNLDSLVGKIQKAYGYSKEMAQKEYNKFRAENPERRNDDAERSVG